jgi:hypothetical protein
MNKFLMIAFFFLLQACSNKNHDTNVSHISVAGIASSSAPATQKAEDYVGQAEQMMAAQAFPEASGIVQLALQQDPQNPKALFLKAILDPIVQLKGILVRIKPLAEQTEQSAKSYAKMIADYQAKPESSLKKFLFDGKPDIATEADLQKQLDISMRLAESSKAILKNLDAVELSFKSEALFIKDMNKRFAAACEIVATANLEYDLKCPPSETRHSVFLNMADYRNLSALVSLSEIYFGIAGGYDLTGAIPIIKKYIDADAIDPQAVTDDLFKNPQFGRIRTTQLLSHVQTFSSEFVGFYQWASTRQAELCPKGVFEKYQRPKMLFANGTCLQGFPIEYFTPIISGKPYDSTSDTPHGAITNTIIPMAFFNNPVKDLHALGPFKFDKCHNLKSIGDTTLNGVFPNGDVNRLLEAEATECN